MRLAGAVGRIETVAGFFVSAPQRQRESIVRDPNKPLCLMLAPYKGGWGAVFEAVAVVLDEVGVDYSWVGANSDVGVGGPFANDIQKRIANADLVIADITDSNPNVMYELGFAHAHRKPVLLVLEKGHPFPFDPMGYLVVVYDRDDPEPLSRYVKLWAERHTIMVAIGA